jgi:very-short-patch-repair endonuclease
MQWSNPTGESWPQQSMSTIPVTVINRSLTAPLSLCERGGARRAGVSGVLYCVGKLLMITDTSRLLRKRSTPAEEAFWKSVRRRRFNGLKFLRQHPIRFKLEGMTRFFIADFFCFELRLVVEIDGGIHEQQKDYDELRSHIIHTLGYRVIRFSNEAVLHNIDVVHEEIGKHSPPRPPL